MGLWPRHLQAKITVRRAAAAAPNQNGEMSMLTSPRLSRGTRASLCALSFGLIACAQSPGTGPQTTTDAGGSGGSAASGSGGSNNDGSGGSQGTAGGAGGATALGSGGTAVVDAAPPIDGNAAADAAEDTGADTAPTPQTFNCTLIIGAGQTLQWFNGGFESAVGTAKWEIKATDNTYTEAWANPASPFWNLAVQSPCRTDATTPDRVLFIVYSKTITAEADWETQINKAMANLKTKFPSVTRIDLLSMVRGPADKMCGTAVATTVSAAQDQAAQAVADASAGMIKVGPQYFAVSCSAFATSDNTNLTPAGAMAVGEMVAAFYK